MLAGSNLIYWFQFQYKLEVYTKQAKIVAAQTPYRRKRAIKAYIARNSTANAKRYNAEGRILRCNMQVHELISATLRTAFDCGHSTITNNASFKLFFYQPNSRFDSIFSLHFFA